MEKTKFRCMGALLNSSIQKPKEGRSGVCDQFDLHMSYIVKLCLIEMRSGGQGGTKNQGKRGGGISVKKRGYFSFK